jgi:hypothetical protein
MRIGASRTIEIRRVEIAETEIRWVESGVLPCDDDRGGKAEGAERVRHRRELDRFGPCADNQPYIRETQISP